ncbi:MAG: cysteine--tRNA ligase [bacterium]|nr:cysteine--tRNA ligase [bacterium]
MLKLFNTLTRKKEPFKPIKNKSVHLFVCGPTVYDYMHIGHAKTYIQFDVIVKYLRSRGYNVVYLQNITDLDDKIIKRAQEEKIKPSELAQRFEDYYHEDEKKLNITAVTKYAKATDYIKQMVKQTEALIQKSYAYKISDGYYFDISRFADYGKLSHRTVLGAEDAVSRIDDGLEKRNKGDFCLWKFSKPNEPSWDSKLGKGRPGWHIEDTAITETNFGPQYDIHGGARDLIFPHHEAEIAQMESASGKKPLVRYWLHTGFLNVDSQKMSKSLGNFITVRDALKKYNYRVLRFFYIASHYRSPIDYNEQSLEGAKNSLERLNDFVGNLESNKKDNTKLLKELKTNFLKAMDDDFDTVKALAVIFNFIRDSYKNKVGGEKTYKFFEEIDQIFGILTFKKNITDSIRLQDELITVFIKGGGDLSPKARKLVLEREKARKSKDFKKSDELREKIKSLGYSIEDAADGPKVKKI